VYTFNPSSGVFEGKKEAGNPTSDITLPRMMGDVNTALNIKLDGWGMLMISIGRRIAGRRVYLGISQEELAARIESSQKQISRYETDSNSPSAETIVGIAEALETTTDYLLGRIDDPARPFRSTSDLDDGERQLLEIYRQKTPEKRRQLVEVARVL
jgi:transcriptional regulator with XRE-family HTH domain